MITPQIMGNVVLLSEYKTQAQKRKLIEWLQKLMGLSDWKISVDHTLDNWNLWECVSDSDDMSAEISFKPWLDWQELVETVTHELGHVVTTKLRELQFIRKLTSERAFNIIERRLLEHEEEVVENFSRIIANLLK